MTFSVRMVGDPYGGRTERWRRERSLRIARNTTLARPQHEVHISWQATYRQVNSHFRETGSGSPGAGYEPMASGGNLPALARFCFSRPGSVGGKAP